jgi:hypothetical protein
MRCASPKAWAVATHCGRISCQGKAIHELHEATQVLFVDRSSPGEKRAQPIQDNASMPGACSPLDRSTKLSDEPGNIGNATNY